MRCPPTSRKQLPNPGSYHAGRRSLWGTKQVRFDLRSSRWPALACLLIFLQAAGCSKSVGTQAALALNRGVSALEAGRYREAQEACFQASTLEQQNRSARMCWLAASIAQGDWHQAGEALAAARLLWPDDPWLRAVSVEISYRLTGQAQEAKIDSEAMAWACAGGACLPAPLDESQQGGVGLLASGLVRIKEGLWEEASALLESQCPQEGPCTDVLLLTWVKLNRFDRIQEWLRKHPCEEDGRLAANLRAFLQPGSGECGGPEWSGEEWNQGEACRMVARASQHPPGDPDRISMLESVCAIEPNWAVPLVLAAMELLRKGETRRARVYLQRALEVTQERGWPALLLSVTELVTSGHLGNAFEGAVSEGTLPPGWRQWLESLVR